MGLSNTEPQSTDNEVIAGNQNLTLGQRANEILRDAQTDENNKVILPADIPNDLKEFVSLEKQRRDTQSAYTKGQQENATLKAEKEALLAGFGSGSISHEDQAKLEELKYDDPDKWYQEKQRLEAEAKTAARQSVDNTLGTARQTAKEAYMADELKRREKVLTDFTSNTGLNLTQDIIMNDVPPRIQKKLENGMEFGAWLYEVAEYLKTPKRIENETIDNVTDIGSAGAGNGTPPASYGSDTIY